MRACLNPPPFSEREPVTEILHGVPVTDAYRWLEEQNSPRTRKWLEEQRAYTRAYLTAITGRERIRTRIREFLAVETYDSLQMVGKRFFFRRRLPDQEQPCIYMRDGADGEDQLLLDPAKQGLSSYTAVVPVRVSPDGRLLLYEVKEGGETTGAFAFLNVESRERLPEVLPRGYLHGFAFAPDGKSFYYVHEALGPKRSGKLAVYHHVFSTPVNEDREIFSAGKEQNLQLHLISDTRRLGFIVKRFLEKTRTDFYIAPFECDRSLEEVVADVDYSFGPQLVLDRVVAITDREAPNLRIVELRLQKGRVPEWVDVVAESTSRINRWVIAGDRIFVSYNKQTSIHTAIFDLTGRHIGQMPTRCDETVQIISSEPENQELLVETQSFTDPIQIFRYSAETGEYTLWAKRSVPFDSKNYGYSQVQYASKDGTQVLMSLVGRCDVLASGPHPTIMTSYGGFGIPMTPQFSIFVAFMIERGCLFALPNIRGGSEFGAAWHSAAQKRKRQTAYADFLCGAEWLVKTGRTSPDKLAIFGGSNSGLLVGAALTQRPDLFRVVICMVPMLDMIRYHLFDKAHFWRDEYGTADDPDDYTALSGYSPYHQVQDGLAYPATMIISGDVDNNCNPMHARKMTARLQAANVSDNPILLDYSEFRGHAPVLPLSARIEGLTDRMAFLCDQLRIST